MDMATRCAAAELELQAKGSTHGEAQAAVRMSRRWALGVAAKVAPDIRERVAMELLESRLRDVEDTYLKAVRAAMASESV